MDIVVLKKRGLSQREIACKLGISRQTVKKYLEHPEMVGRYIRRKLPKSKLDPFAGNIVAWLEEDSQYKATWIYDHLIPLGYRGSYETVKRRIRQLKEQRSRRAYMRFETEPGRQAQVDFSEFQVVCSDGNSWKYYLFSMILGYSRKIYAELIEHCDVANFLDCHIRAFEYFGGVVQEVLYDRMKNVFIRKVAGKSEFNKTLMGFAVHYGFKPEVTPAYAPWIKGKVERPYSFIREGFWRGYSFTNLERANRDLMRWLQIKDERIHGTTHERIQVRFEREQPFLGTLPQCCFDTSYRAYRKVHKDCTVHFEGNRYVVAHRYVGSKVVLRVKDKGLQIYADNNLVVSYVMPEGKGHLVQDPRFYKALREDREMNRRKYTDERHHKGRAKHTISPTRMLYEMDVEVRPLSTYTAVAEARR
ncbi:MAG: IS21 family transposase [Planctomycetota bacterium]